MDMISLLAAGSVGYQVLFNVESGVEMNAKDIASVKAEVRREVEKLNSDMQIIRQKSREDRQLINQKLDRLIELKLYKNGTNP